MFDALATANFNRDIAAMNRTAVARMGWTIINAEYPLLDVVFTHATARPIRLQLDCIGWDDVPPAIELLEADGAPIVQMPQDPRNIFNANQNPLTGRPFICTRGSRHYHQLHPEDAWANHRGRPGMDLGGILFQLWRVWKAIAR